MEVLPVAFFRGSAVLRAHAPRQGVFNPLSSGSIVFLAGHGYDQALRDLEGFDRLWVIFHFHHNPNWRPTVRPPVPPEGRDRVGVFASRSPYRPNPIGLSCVRLNAIRGLELDVSEADLLDGTPILDIKPYIPAADSFPDARHGWVETQQSQAWLIQVDSETERASQWILQNSGLDLIQFANVQLSHNPLDPSRKRVERISSDKGILSCRTWRIHFQIESDQRSLRITRITTGYPASELAQDSPDPYLDKEIHREFLRLNPSRS